MSKFANLILALNWLHPNPAPPASEDQNQATKIRYEGNEMNRIASFAAAIVVVFPIAFAVLVQAAQIVA